ncbi:MAG TPA: hypothetical protein VEZ89_02030, partial [Rubrivivax sp.]|nr:hypothetical protein [Rubrivivax sp.]
MHLTDELPTVPAPPTDRLRHCAVVALAAAIGGLGLFGPTVAAAQSQPARSGIYTCTDLSGKRWTSDRPIPACHGLEQRVLNADGSTRAVVAPPMTADE